MHRSIVRNVSKTNIKEGGQRMTVQKRVATYLLDNGITQAFVAEKTGIKRKRMSDILTLKSKMKADEYEKICKALGKTPNDFMETA